jgi:hypothetical protein
MSWFRHSSVRFASALFAWFVITGDIVADAVHDATGVCASESQSGCEECPACGCTIHTGSAVAPEAVTLVSPTVATTEWLRASDQKPAIGPAASIDHPPQLS